MKDFRDHRWDQIKEILFLDIIDPVLEEMKDAILIPKDFSPTSRRRRKIFGNQNGTNLKTIIEKVRSPRW